MKKEVAILMKQTVPRWLLNRWLLLALAGVDLWVAVTGRPVGPVEFPRVTAVVMLAFFGILIVNSWRRDMYDLRPPVFVNILLPCIPVVALILGIAT